MDVEDLENRVSNLRQILLVTLEEKITKRCEILTCIDLYQKLLDDISYEDIESGRICPYSEPAKSEPIDPRHLKRLSRVNEEFAECDSLLTRVVRQYNSS